MMYTFRLLLLFALVVIGACIEHRANSMVNDGQHVLKPRLPVTVPANDNTEVYPLRDYDVALQDTTTFALISN
jgi:hypothetical protein